MKWVFLAFAIMWMGHLMKWLFGDGDGSSRRPSGKASRRAVAELDAALEQRDLVIEDLQRRIGELESRLDFTERLLATSSPADRLAGSAGEPLAAGPARQHSA